MTDMFKGLTKFLFVCAGALGLGGGVTGYAAHAYIVQPRADAADFDARGRAVLSSLRLTPITVDAFKKGAKGCAAPQYGASFVAEDFDSKIVYGVMCVSKRSELTFRVLR